MVILSLLSGAQAASGPPAGTLARDVLEVIGHSYAAIYDAQDPRPFVLIAPGERYNLKSRSTP